MTGRERIVKVEGGYHGHHDEVMISIKPPLELAGPAEQPNPIPSSLGITKRVVEDVIVIPFNDPDALERALQGGDVACFIVEPVMENIGICLPEPGYLEAVREITERYGTLLIFDEVKTGITAGYGGATSELGVTPDLVTLAKSIGGGFPVGAFGGKVEHMNLIAQGKVVHLGTYNGNPLVMAAAKATLSEACTLAAHAEANARNGRLVDACQAIIDRSGIPAHTVRFGAKGCVTWSPDTGAQLPRLQDYRLRPGVRTMDPRHQPRRAPAPGPRRAVADLGDARRQRRHALRRGLRRVRAGADGLTSVASAAALSQSGEPQRSRGPRMTIAACTLRRSHSSILQLASCKRSPSALSPVMRRRKRRSASAGSIAIRTECFHGLPPTLWGRSHDVFITPL